MSNVIPYGKQWVDRSDIEAVVRVLKSNRLTQGPGVERFEEAFAKYCGVPYAVAVSSGTAALHLAALAAGFGPGDEVVTSPLTFVASANCILYVGATPRFVDIEETSLGLDPGLVSRFVGSTTKGIVSVDFAGHPCRIGPKADYSKKKDFLIIEDACHALGAEVKKGGRWVKAGACEREDMAVFSFHPVKHITTGEGGMITTRRRDFYEKLRILRSHGIVRDPRRFVDPDADGKPWVYEMTALGFNYRITDIQCALGLSQLKRIHSVVGRRRQIADFYNESLRDIEHIQLPRELDGFRSSWHLYVLRINFKKLGAPRQAVMATLQKKGIATQVHYIPVTSQPYYKKRFGFKKGNFPVTESYYEEALSIPIFPTMTHAQIKRVAEMIKSVSRSCR